MKYIKHILIFLFAIAINHSPAQESEDDNSWEAGYIVYKKRSDTLRGFLNINYSSFAEGYIKSFRFRISKDEKKGMLIFSSYYHADLDTIRFLGIGPKQYKYINYTDDSIPTKRFQNKNSIESWVEIVGVGKINICKGYAISEYDDRAGKIYTSMYCLKKGKNPTVLIAGPPLNIFNKDNVGSQPIDDRNKMHFITVISDNPELLLGIKTKTLTFQDVENIVKEYNNKL